MHVETTFSPSRADTIALAWESLRLRPLLLASHFGFFGVVPLVLVLIELEAPAFFGRATSFSQLALMLLIPAAMLGFPLVLPWLLHRKSPGLQGPQTFSFSDDGMRFVGPAFENRASWSTVTQVLWRPPGLLLAGGKLPLAFIPDRAMSVEFRHDMSELLQRLGIRGAKP